jgi:chromate transporter
MSFTEPAVALEDEERRTEPNSVSPEIRTELGNADELDPVLREMPYITLFLTFLKFGIMAWGGPMAQIDMLRSHFADRLQWISKAKFNRVLAVYQALPGPEATELACYFGMMSRGRPGAVLAGIGFLLPGFVLMLIISVLYVRFGIQNPEVAKSLSSMQLCVAAMVIRAVHRISETALLRRDLQGISIPLLLLAIFSALQSVAGINFAISLIFGGLIYAFYSKAESEHHRAVSANLSAADSSQFELETIGERPISTIPQQAPFRSTYTWYIATAVLVIGGTALALVLRYSVGLKWLGGGGAPTGGMIASNSLLGLFLLGLLAGLLTFGGAYTAIPFVQQDAVVAGQWITPEAFLDGIALTQVIPTPLVMFSTFVGYIGKGFPGAILMTIGMFIPAFSFTLIGHNFFERIVNIQMIHAFLDGVTGSVIGLIAVTAAQFVKDTVSVAVAAILFGLCLASLYAFKSPWLSPLLVCSAAIVGQVLL